MMRMVYDNISTLDNRFSATNKVTAAMALALRYWQAAHFCAGDEDKRAIMQRASHTALIAHRRNPPHSMLYVLTIFLAIEAGSYDTANDMLDKAMAHKAFFRTHMPHIYAQICFLYAYLEIRQRRMRSAKKYWRLLVDHIRDTGVDYPVFIGLLHLAAAEYADAYTSLAGALASGNNSVLVYEGLYRYYSNMPHAASGDIILKVLTYVARRGGDITNLALMHEQTIQNAILQNLQAGEALYAISGYAPFLRAICTTRLNAHDFGQDSYNFYTDALRKQINVPGLFSAIVYASYLKGTFHINHYAMAKFFEEANIEPEIAVYAYNILILDPIHSDTLASQHENILNLAKDYIHASSKNSDAYGLLYYYWLHCRNNGSESETMQKIEEKLSGALTKFRLELGEDSQVKHVYITEPMRRDMVVYDASAGSHLIVEASDSDFSYTCLGAGQRAILDEKIDVQRLIPGACVEFYQHLFNRGDRRFYVISFLAKRYLQMETPPDAAIPVFEAMLQEKVASKSHKVRILVTLGRMHYNAFSFDEALACYALVDEDALDNDLVEPLLSVYMKTSECERALRLILKKYHLIKHEVLVAATISLVGKPNIKLDTLASIAYKLLLQGEPKPVLVELVAEHYQASYSEWVGLYRQLGRDIRIAKKVLETAIWMARWDAEMQDAFLNCHKNSVLEGDSLIDFVELAKYEMLRKSTCPQHDIIEVLQQICINEKDYTLSLGLASVYLEHNIATPFTQEVTSLALSVLQEKNILLPIFKKHRHAARIPFAEKLHPFVYYGQAGRTYHMHYRIGDTSSYEVVRMQYLKYGIFIACLPLFYNEEMVYFFSEEQDTGSVTTKEEFYKNTTTFLHSHDTDHFFAINNAIIYEQMFKHEQVEKIIGELVMDVHAVRSRLF